MEVFLRYLFIDIPEGFFIIAVGLATFNFAIAPRLKVSLLSGFIFGTTSFIFTFIEVPYQPKILMTYILTCLLFIFLFKNPPVLSILMSTSAYAAQILAEFFIIIGFNLLHISIEEIYQNKVFQYLASASYLTLLALPAYIFRRLQFDLRHLVPQKRHNRYLVLLVLTGSVEFLLILFINTSYILQINNSSFQLIYSPWQQSLVQLLTLAMFIVMVFLFRTYLNLTINRVEEETETPYLENIKDLLTAIRSIKHDVVNHYTAINGFLQKEMYGLAHNYVKHQLQEATTIEKIVESRGSIIQDIKSPAVAALVNSKMAICLADHISFSILVTNSSQFTFMKTNDLIKVLGNLLDNAIRAAQQEIEENRYIQMIWDQNDEEQFLMIENSGPTIPREKLDQVYDLRFTSKNNGEGGVGLAVVKGVVTRYGGSISVQSENGITRFCISFPIS